jgi:hypothetical protein
MGIVDDVGDEIVPIQYTSIGTIGYTGTDIVEVGNAGKVGYFDIKTKRLIIEPIYDMIIPYKKESAIAIVKSDSTYGWIDEASQFHSGFPSLAAEQWVGAFGFIPSAMKISKHTEGICESPTETQIGRGVFMAPSYLYRTGVFERITDGISTTEIPMHGWTEYIETSGTRVETIGENLRALITTISERYLEGREEFYQTDQLVFVNDKSETLSVSQIISDAEITRANDTILQVKATSMHEYDTEIADMSGLPSYRYFKIQGASILPLETKLSFAPLRFVKIDSTYLQGNFTWYNDDGSGETTFLTLAAITHLRNELLASYGYSFPGNDDQQRYAHHGPATKIESLEEVHALMTEIERYNIAFLERVINRMQGTAL